MTIEAPAKNSSPTLKPSKRKARAERAPARGKKLIEELSKKAVDTTVELPDDKVNVSNVSPQFLGASALTAEAIKDINLPDEQKEWFTIVFDGPQYLEDIAGLGKEGRQKLTDVLNVKQATVEPNPARKQERKLYVTEFINGKSIQEISTLEAAADETAVAKELRKVASDLTDALTETNSEQILNYAKSFDK